MVDLHGKIDDPPSLITVEAKVLTPSPPRRFMSQLSALQELIQGGNDM
jgi:hypothetical protein